MQTCADNAHEGADPPRDDEEELEQELEQDRLEQSIDIWNKVLCMKAETFEQRVALLQIITHGSPTQHLEQLCRDLECITDLGGMQTLQTHVLPAMIHYAKYRNGEQQSVAKEPNALEEFCGWHDKMTGMAILVLLLVENRKDKIGPFSQQLSLDMQNFVSQAQSITSAMRDNVACMEKANHYSRFLYAQISEAQQNIHAQKELEQIKEQFAELQLKNERLEKHSQLEIERLKQEKERLEQHSQLEIERLKQEKERLEQHSKLETERLKEENERLKEEHQHSHRKSQKMAEKVFEMSAYLREEGFEPN